ncbi:MAG: hypothetical protein AB8B72_04000 [Crocinitomicaceae bacterium]
MILERGVHLCLLFSAIIFSGFTYGNKTSLHSTIIDFSDSLILQNTTTNEFILIRKGGKIKVWSNGKAHKGRFVSLKDDILTLQQQSDKKWIDIKTITKIKDISDPTKNFLGCLGLLYGTGFVGASAVFTGIGVYSLIKEGTIIILVAVPVALLGIGFLKLGQIIRGQDYEMSNNWVIVNPELVIR